jgi:hypothetical protein
MVQQILARKETSTDLVSVSKELRKRQKRIGVAIIVSITMV